MKSSKENRTRISLRGLYGKAQDAWDGKGMPISAIAVRLGISHQAVEKTLKRALGKLAPKLEHLRQAV